MRHRKHSNQLGLKKEHREALLANLSTALLTHGRIKTTLKKAKALRPFVEKVITLAKNGSLHSRRMAISRVRDTDAVHGLFDDKVEQFREREGGYTRIYKLGTRRGDAAEMALIELIDADDEGYEKKRKPKSKAKAEPQETASPVEAEEIEDAAAAEASEDAAGEPPEDEELEKPIAEAETPDAEDSEPKAEAEDSVEEEKKG
ncbi:MAG TPA: 50S ribosomal protein L17 [Opitutae bacterium]|nr:50S ribosomal protein L17 [Opitutaceae bacterium]HCR30506.1 50S ribosomal protein L17 [Opitutae bacterium]